MSASGTISALQGDAGTRADREQAARALAELEAVGAAGTQCVNIDGTLVRLSNVDKVMYPATGFTKLDVACYYAMISPVLLPHLRERALTLKRYPGGVDKPFFYQKRCPGHRPEWMRADAVQTDPDGDVIDYCIPEDVRGLVWMASLADLELHVLLSKVEDVQRPTSIVFDLDPGEGVDVLACAQVALLVRDLFADLGLRTWVKTSGSKGLQVYAPLNDEHVTYEQTKPLAKAVAQLLERQHPDLVVHKMLKSLRRGKVLVDWSQNDPHKTTVCVYSLRAKHEPTVSTPVTWDEVEHACAAADADLLRFTYADVAERVARDGDLFAPVLTTTQHLPAL